MSVTIDTGYRHYKNNKIYIPKFFCSIQINNEWVPAIGYIELNKDNHNPYIRSIEEFQQKFIRVNDE